MLCCWPEFSVSLLKCLLKISTSSSLLLIVLLLLLKIIDSLWKAFSEERGRTVFQNFLLSDITLWFSFPENRLLVLWSKLRHKFIWLLKHFLDSSFLVFKNLFLSLELFIIAFLSSLVIQYYRTHVHEVYLDIAISSLYKNKLKTSLHLLTCGCVL